MNPLALIQAAGWLRAHWRGLALASAAVATAGTIGVQRFEIGRLSRATTELSATLKTAAADRDAAIANRDAWKAAAAREQQLATATAAARAEERRNLATIAAQAATAKEGIRNAPGSSDSFVFSDAAYGVMRAPPAAGPDDQRSAAPAASDVDR